MIRTYALALAPLFVLGATAAIAAPKPYEPLTVTYDTTGSDDPELKTFIETLQKAVDSGDVATLKASVAQDLKIYAPLIGFPDEAPPAALANPDKHLGEQRLDEAAAKTTSSDTDYSREDLDSLIVDVFGMALEPKSIGKSKTADGALCSPAEAAFDRQKALDIAAAADVPPGNLWILSDKTDFREKPNLSAPVVATLPAGTIVPFLEGSVEVTPAEQTDEDWYSVVLPSGKIAYGANDSSLAFQAVSVCYAKTDGHWAVTAIVVPGV
ncbi:hypothetical protein C3941_16280 [Kaistia algarum]|uniref:SH3 domain-containing protein n=1 Tax=Kaistia algarum TaxID=2083279 RepID=UPI000CE78772|nr:SH3 domain-containing protein [Kaistia algarum]MCX5514627.1 SH3 domain-containing protein [Kaistia algarum]PPE78936.1 hypothetical protein C3941_16280 [Kaistia algarum]